MSKTLEGDLQLRPGQPCLCTCDVGQQVIARVCYRTILPLRANADCDETNHEPLLQDGAELWLSGKLTLRQSTCKESGMQLLVGSNEGTYRIHRYRPNEDVFAGPFCGTIGFAPPASGGSRCCAAGHGLGSISGAGFNSLEGWSLCASFHSEVGGVSDNAEAMCKEMTLRMKMNVDGVLTGPCERMGA
jgi:hypothetical protein